MPCESPKTCHLCDAHPVQTGFSICPDCASNLAAKTLHTTLGDEPMEDPAEFELLEETGKGGQGRVWKARQTHPIKRTVAIKMLRKDRLNESYAKRLRQEGINLSAMKHPNIATIYGAGFMDDGSPYLAMEWIDGRPITMWAAERNLSLVERVDLLIQL